MKKSREVYYNGAAMPLLHLGMNLADQPELPSRVYWLTAAQRSRGRKPSSQSYKLKSDLTHWLDENMRDGYQPVRIHWTNTSAYHHYRFAIRLNSDRDAVIFRLFWG